MQVFQKALESEQANTRSIHELYRLSLELNDYSTQSFLKWFVDEQVEEERVVGDAIGLLEHAGDDKSALLVLNQQFGERTAGAESA
jgi:ferritin